MAHVIGDVAAAALRQLSQLAVAPVIHHTVLIHIAAGTALLDSVFAHLTLGVAGVARTLAGILGGLLTAQVFPPER